jgi:hypothetical protein
MPDFGNGDSCMKHVSVIMYILALLVVADEGKHFSLIPCFTSPD